MARPEVALVHDYLTQRGGAERVVLSMLRLFPDAPLYTALYEPESTYPELKKYDIRPLWTNKIAGFRQNHRRGLMVYPLAFSNLTVDADLTLCSSSGFAHGVSVTGQKIVYCYSPPRWLYDQADAYLAGWPTSVSVGLKAVAPALRRWDRDAATSADAYLTSSAAVRDRIRDVYGIQAKIVPPSIPAIAHRERRPIPGIEEGFMLCVSRLLAYKNVEAVAAAFQRLPHVRLVIVGTGPLAKHLESACGSNVTMLARVDDLELAWLYANCAGVVCASFEDFGLTALEANALAKPVAALRSGGFLDTVIDGKTGVFFDRPHPAMIAAAVGRLLAAAWDPPAMTGHSDYFAERSFGERLLEALESSPRPVGSRFFYRPTTPSHQDSERKSA